MRGYVFTYIDEFIIFSADKNSHIQHLCNVFKVLDNFGLKIYEKKITFAKNSVKFLAHVVSKEGIIWKNNFNFRASETHQCFWSEKFPKSVSKIS